MKQHITEEQLRELSKEQLSKLEDWVNRDPITKKVISKKYQWNISGLDFSIGQMIEFLHEHVEGLSIMYPYENEQDSRVRVGFLNHLIIKDDLCDALWEAVKETLV